MVKSIISGIFAVLILLTIIVDMGYSQGEKIQPVRLMFYNVENLFDIYDDTLRDDNDLLPGGVMRWTFTRYNKKINSLYKTIVAAGEWSPPAIIALCEIENRKVLEDLVYGTYLSKYNYRIVHEDSPDMRGIDVCMIYRNDRTDLIEYKYWPPPRTKSGENATRSVLYAKLRISDDTVHLIVNHWPSRRGGVLAAEDLRKEIAEMVRVKVDSLVNSSKAGAKIIITGDFNCSPEDQVMRSFISNADSCYSLINLSEGIAGNGLGTYRYMGVWEMIDQVLVSNGLLDNNSGIYTDAKKLHVFRPDFLLVRDTKYPGLTPFPTYRGYRYQGGFSDHLPVLIDFNFRYPGQQE